MILRLRFLFWISLDPIFFYSTLAAKPWSIPPSKNHGKTTEFGAEGQDQGRHINGTRKWWSPADHPGGSDVLHILWKSRTFVTCQFASPSESMQRNQAGCLRQANGSHPQTKDKQKHIKHTNQKITIQPNGWKNGWTSQRKINQRELNQPNKHKQTHHSWHYRISRFLISHL